MAFAMACGGAEEQETTDTSEAAAPTTAAVSPTEEAMEEEEEGEEEAEAATTEEMKEDTTTQTTQEEETKEETTKEDSTMTDIDPALKAAADALAGGPGAIYVGDLDQLIGPVPTPIEDDIGDYDGVPPDGLEDFLYVFDSDY